MALLPAIGYGIGHGLEHSGVSYGHEMKDISTHAMGEMAGDTLSHMGVGRIPSGRSWRKNKQTKQSKRRKK
jgi:hypothetical protein